MSFFFRKSKLSLQTSSSSKKGSRGEKSRPFVPPSPARLARIEAATGLAMQHQQETINEILKQSNKALSPTGLVESLNDAFDEVAEAEELDAPDEGMVDVAPRSESKESEDTNETSDGGPTIEEEAELRRTVQALFELEEALLNQHMSNLQVCCW